MRLGDKDGRVGPLGGPVPWMLDGLRRMCGCGDRRRDGRRGGVDERGGRGGGGDAAGVVLGGLVERRRGVSTAGAVRSALGEGLARVLAGLLELGIEKGHPLALELDLKARRAAISTPRLASRQRPLTS